MIMKWLNFKTLLTVLTILFIISPASARKRWDVRENWRYEGWERIKPKNAKLQYAGGMGFLSFGIGWEYGKKGMWNTDAIVGFIPSGFADKFRMTFSLKQTVTPWSIRFCKFASFEPLTAGIYMTTINGDEFWKKEPGKYPNGYYNFSSKIRFSVCLGQSFSFHFKNAILNNSSIFYEVSSNDLYNVSKATNKSLKMKDILRFSIGLKFHFRPQNP